MPSRCQAECELERNSKFRSSFCRTSSASFHTGHPPRSAQLQSLGNWTGVWIFLHDYTEFGHFHICGKCLDSSRREGTIASPIFVVPADRRPAVSVDPQHKVWCGMVWRLFGLVDLQRSVSPLFGNIVYNTGCKIIVKLIV